MFKTTLWMAVAALVLAGGVFAYHAASSRASRPDCPGRIICPITGQEICSDQCPLAAKQPSPGEKSGCCRASE